MKMTIREMEKRDWEAVAEIYRLGIETNIATFQTEIPTYEAWDGAHLKICRYVIGTQNSVAGWIALSPVSSRCVYGGVAEVSIYIHPKEQQKGYAKELLNKVITDSMEQGLWTLQSGIMQDNKGSIRLHECCGFRMVGYREKIAKDKFGTWRNTVLMERRNSLE